MVDGKILKLFLRPKIYFGTKQFLARLFPAFIDFIGSYTDFVAQDF